VAGRWGIGNYRDFVPELVSHEQGDHANTFFSGSHWKKLAQGRRRR
jgi:hypothetical protein